MKMFFEILLLIIAIIFLSYLSFYFARIVVSPSLQENSLGSVCMKEACFQVETAKTEAQREKGLMYKNILEKDRGMLFIFDKEGIYPFWMKNTLIPLDIIWIDGNNKVVFVNQNTQPCKSLICSSIIPSAKARYVLEINAGLYEEFGVKLGDELKISY